MIAQDGGIMSVDKGGTMRIYIRSADQYYRYDASPRWAKEHDNGALVSCGLTVGESLKSVPRMAVKVSKAEWNHSSCLSRCKDRGDNICQW